MRIAFDNASADNGMLVRWSKDGHSDFAAVAGNACVVIPEGVERVSVDLTGLITGTPQIVFEPAWPKTLGQAE